MRKTALIIAAIMILSAMLPVGGGFTSSAEAGTAVIGSTVTFGSYPQGANGEVGPIEWIVLDIDEDGCYVMMSKYGLDALKYNEKSADTTWESCSLRGWLNGEFFDTAFSDEEKVRIQTTHVVNGGNAEFGTDGGADTDDNVYILSTEEAESLFASDAERICGLTDYALARGAAESGIDTEDGRPTGRWWLRTPGSVARYAAVVGGKGSVGASGYSVDISGYAVRPVVRVDMTGTEYAPAPSIAIGETVTFGSYPQGANGEVMPIEWTVLDIDEDGYYVLISNYGLDAREYNEQDTAVTWEDCTLRSWLNNEFYYTAFNPEEQLRIKTTYVINNGNPEYGTSGGNDTEDKVYLLSVDEIIRYYGVILVHYEGQDDALCCRPADYAIANGAWVFDHTNQDLGEEYAVYDGNCWWWLRSPGSVQDCATGIRSRGEVSGGGHEVSRDTSVVRPVVRVDMTGIKTASAPAVDIGDTVTFGSYPQGANGEVAPIEWTILDIDEDGYCVLISRYGLDAKAYNEENTAVTWEDCTLRAWLNDAFYYNAFNSEEQSVIKTTHVVNSDNYDFEVSGGNDTEDKVYLLSVEEITQYYGIGPDRFFEMNEELCCRPTEYAVANGAIVFVHTEEQYANYDGSSWWWLRTYCPHYNHVIFINMDGYILVCDSFDYDDFIIRPVVRVRLKNV